MPLSLPRTLAALALAGGVAGFSAPASATCNAEPVIGEICVFAFNYCPVGYLPTSGWLMQIQQYQALYSLIGTTYGGDGFRTFKLPDLSGRVPVGTGSAPGANTPNLALGRMVGGATVTLTPDNLPQHTHAATFTPTVNASPADVAETAAQAPAPTQDGQTIQVVAQPADSVPQGTVAIGGTVTIGPNPPPRRLISTQSPVLGMTVCIAYAGIYPIRE